MPSGTTPGGKPTKAAPAKTPAKATPPSDGAPATKTVKTAAKKGAAAAPAPAPPAPVAVPVAAAPAATVPAAEAPGAAVAAPDRPAKAAFAALSKKDIAHFEKRLLEERRRVLKELGHHGETFGASQRDSDGDLSSYSFHMADQGTDAMEREKAFLFASQEGRFLWHIDEALRRLYASPGTFGRCHSCGGTIAFERLDALPHARYCFDCKQREEEGKRGG